MPITIGSNIASLGIQRKLAQGSDALSKTFERLGSGQRINHAADDAAGLSVALSLNAHVRIFTQAIRNINDGVGQLSIADGALAELSNITVRQMELAEQAANGTFTFQQRKALNSEANALVDEYNRIVQSTKFNGQSVLDSESLSGNLNLQIGATSSDYISLATNQELDRFVGDGTFKARLSLASFASYAVQGADVNGDGHLDLVTADSGNSTIGVYLGNGNGTFAVRTEYSSPEALDLGVVDLNQDGKLDIVASRGSGTGIAVLQGNGDGTFKAAVVYSTSIQTQQLSLGDVNGDGLTDVATMQAGGSSFAVLLGNANGSFKAASYTPVTAGAINANFGDLNGDGKLDVVVTRLSLLTTFLGVGDGTFTDQRTVSFSTDLNGVVFGDYNGDGFNDLALSGSNSNTLQVVLGNGDGSLQAPLNTPAVGTWRYIASRDINGDGISDLALSDQGSSVVKVFTGNGNGTFRSSATLTAGTNPHAAFGDFNEDGAIDIVSGDQAGGTVSLFLANGHSVTTMQRLDLYTAVNARQTLDLLSTQLARISSERASIGSNESRLSFAWQNLRAMRENFEAAAARITDSDIAEESANLVRTQILQQAGAAVLVQANQQPTLALQLLRAT